MSWYVHFSTTLTFMGFMFNLLALWVPGWGSSCVTCNWPQANSYVCYYVGLFDYCESALGLETCYGFSPGTVQKSDRSIGYYYAAQFFMVSAVVVGGWYVVQEAIHIMFSKYKPVELRDSAMSSNKVFFAFTFIETLFSFITMAIWAHQYNTHEHMSPHCSKIYFDYGRSFGLCIVGWLLCFFNMVFRGIFRAKFSEAKHPALYTLGVGMSGSSDIEPYKAM